MKFARQISQALPSQANATALLAAIHKATGWRTPRLHCSTKLEIWKVWLVFQKNWILNQYRVIFGKVSTILLEHSALETSFFFFTSPSFLTWSSCKANLGHEHNPEVETFLSMNSVGNLSGSSSLEDDIRWRGKQPTVKQVILW